MVLRHFEKQIGKDLKDIKNFLDIGDSAGLFQKAHALKGAASAVCAGRIRELAMLMEQLGKEKNVQEAKTHVEVLEQEVSECLRYLKSLESGEHRHG